MINDGCSHVVVASLMALVNSTKQVHHVFKELSSLIPLANTVNTFDDDLINDLTCVSVDQHDPLVDEIPFGPELNINCFQHLYAPHNVVKPRLRGSLSTDLVHENQVFSISFQLRCHVKTCNDQISSDLKKLRVC